MIHEIFLLFKFLLLEKKIPKILITSSVKSIHFISQSAILTPFLAPMPAISHFALLILSPEKRENLQNILITSVAVSRFLEKRLCHLHKQSIRMYD